MATERETLRLLCKSIISRLENKKSVTFAPRLRQVIQDEIFDYIGPLVLTEQDLRERSLAKMGAKTEALNETGLAESDQYKAAKAVVRGTFGDDELNGFYFQKPLKSVAHSIAEYLMRSSHIDDVFETDDDLEKQIIEVVRKFNPSELH